MSSRVRDAFWRLKNYLGILVLFLIGILFFGGVLFTVQDNSDFLGATDFTLAATSSDATAILEIGNTAPVISEIKLNGSLPIILVPNTTTAIDVFVEVADNNGCTDIQNGTTTILVYRSGVSSSTCLTTQNNLNCYIATAFSVSSTCTLRSVNTTTTFGIYYFAEPTDASNSLYSSQNWLATVIFKDQGNATTSADSAGVELNSMTALELSTSSIDYGTLNSSSTTGFVNEVEGIINAGNTSSTVKVHGTALVKGSDRIATSSQHYASSSFYFGGTEQELQETATTISGITLLPRVSLINDLGSWGETTALPSSPRFSEYANSPSYMYVLGGLSTTTVRYAAFSANGTIGSWTNTTALSTTRELFGSLVYGNYIYAVGGNGISPSSEYALLNSNGTVGSWISGGTPITGGDYSNFSMAAEHGYLYTFGGVDVTSDIATVYKSQIGSDGSNGAWTTTTALPNVLSDSAAVAYNGYVYVLGGDISGTETSTVRFSAVSSTGALGTWANTTALPGLFSSFGATVLNDNIYILGDATTSVYYAPINSTGSLGSWTETTAMPNSLTILRGLNNNGYIYALPNNGNTSTVIYAQVNNGRARRDTFWGLKLGYEPPGSYSGVTTFTAVYEP